MKKLLILAVLVCSCSACERKPPPVRHAPDGSSCETNFENLKKLGGCGLDLTNYVSHCHDREKAEAEFGGPNRNECVTHSGSCQEAFGCK